MKQLLIFVSFIILTTTAYSKIYYVSTSGSNTNSGLKADSSWRTLTYAAGSSSPIIYGDTVYVKAGNYGAEKVVFQKSGTSVKPIIFIGYKTTPGDAPPLIRNNTNPYASFLSTDMPLFDGGNRANGTAFDCRNQRYLIIKNFQIQNYAYGLIAGSTTQDAGNLIVYNVNAMYLGDANASYSGKGFLLGIMGTQFSNNNTFTNCVVVNSGAEGFDINGNNNIFDGCRVYCNENTANAPTDYYMIVTGNHNIFTSCYIERAAGLSHAGHGFTCKTNAEQVVDNKEALPAISSQYNKFYYCTAKNMGESFCVRHRTAQYNLFYHCKAIGTHTGAIGSSGGEGNCIVTRDGASDNTFDGCIAENCNSGFIFVDTVEDGDTGANPPGHPANNNKYINCFILNCYNGIKFDSYGVQSDAGNNTISNCVFYKTRYMYYAARHCANMKYINNIYFGCLPIKSGGEFKGGAYSSDIVSNSTNTYFKNCDFFNIQGGMPINFVSLSIGSIEKDPMFSDSNLHLSFNSPCIDTGFSIESVILDYNGFMRPSGITYDMGPYER